MHIHLFGASGSGVTTLGKALAAQLQIPYFDADDYYWEPTNPPFQIRVEAITRNNRLVADLNKTPDWILGGSLDSWADFLKHEFDAVVYLWIPKTVRAIRLINREKERYGETLSQQRHDFIDWALAYDDSNRQGRNRKRHEQWIPTLPCPVLRIEEAIEVEEKVKMVNEWLQQHLKQS